MIHQQFVACIVLALACASFYPAQADADEEPVALPKYATHMARYSHPNCGDVDRPLRLTAQKTLAVGCDGGLVQILDPKTGDVLWQSPPDSPKLWGLTFPTDQTMLTITADKRAVLYDLKTQRELARYPLPTGGGGQIVNYHASANRVLLVSEGKDASQWLITAFSATDGAMISRRTLSTYPLASALSPDGLQVAWVSGDSSEPKTIRWTQTEALDQSDHKKFACKPAGRSDYPYPHVQFTPDSAQIAVALSESNHLAFCFHPTDDQAPTRAFSFESDPSNHSDYEAPYQFQFSSDGKYAQLLTLSYQAGRVGDTQTGVNRHLIDTSSGGVLSEAPETAWLTTPFTAQIQGLGLVLIKPSALENGSSNAIPHSLMLASSKPQPLIQFPYTHLGEYSNLISLSPDSHWLIAGDSDKLLLWDTTADPAQRPTQIALSISNPDAFAWSLDSQQVFVSTRAPQMLGRLTLATRTLHTVAHPIPFHEFYPTDNADQVLLCGRSDAHAPHVQFSRFDFKTLAVTPDTTLPDLPHCPAPALANFALKRWLFLSFDANDRFHDDLFTADGPAPFDLPADVRGAQAVLSPNAEWLAVNAKDKVKVVNTSTQKVLATLPATYHDTTFSFSPDNQWLAVANDNEGDPVQLLHIPTQKITKLTPKPALTTKALVFSPDSKTLKTLHSRDRIFTWDLAAVLASP